MFLLLVVNLLCWSLCGATNGLVTQYHSAELLSGPEDFEVSESISHVKSFTLCAAFAK